MKCRECQMACYALLDGTMSSREEQCVLAHIESCTACHDYLMRERRRRERLSGLLKQAVSGYKVPEDTVQRVVSKRSGGLVDQPQRRRVWLAAAASLVAVVGFGLMLKYSADYKARANVRVALSHASIDYGKPAVELLNYNGGQMLELPQQLPGYLNLYDGHAKIRLISGVELTLVAPVSLEIEDSMRVRLGSGSMLAFVPPWASGFTVNTPQLEIWDLGTIFGVSSRGRQDDVFVFKGSVQVNESDGNAVDLCVAGEGVRLERGELPRKIAAEWAEAEQLFVSVAGRRALAEPEKSLKAIDELHEMWLARYKPKPVEKKQVVKAKPKPKPVKTISTGQVAQQITETDKAVVALSAKKQEEEMRAVTNVVAATVAAATLGVANIGLAVPQVSGVQLSQRDGTRVIDISYNLAGDGIVTL